MKYRWITLVLLICVCMPAAVWAQRTHRETRPPGSAMPMPYAALTAVEDRAFDHGVRPSLELEAGRRLTTQNGGFIFDRSTRSTTSRDGAFKDSPSRANHFGSWYVTNTYHDVEGRIKARHVQVTRQNIRALYPDDWSWIFQENFTYFRIRLDFEVTEPVKVKKVVVFNRVAVPEPKESGSADAPVLVTEKYYTAIEHPLAKIVKVPDVSFEWSLTSDSTVRYFDVAGAGREREISCSFAADTGIMPAVNAVALMYDDKVVEATRVSATEFRVKTPISRKGDMQLKVEFAAPAEQEVFGHINFFGYTNKTLYDGVIPVNMEFLPGRTYSYSVVIGGIPEDGQLRRAFANYIQNERVHAYRPFHYFDAWNQFGNGAEKPMNDEAFYSAMRTTDREFNGRRKAKIDGYLVPEGWSDPKSFFAYGQGFVKHFDRLRAEAENQQNGFGAAFAPWGSTDASQAARAEYAKLQSATFAENGLFTLADTVYGKHFRMRLNDIYANYKNMNIAVFDGAPPADLSRGVPDAQAFEMHTLLDQIGQLRVKHPSLFAELRYNLTPSPFWLLHTDCVWRGGDLVGQMGDGNTREQWITYRDAMTYRNIVSQAPLFPLNAVSNGGVCVGARGEAGKLLRDGSTASDRSFANEVWMSAGSGAPIKLDIDHALMSDTWYSLLTDAMRWGRGSTDLLVDAHWIGGDPAKNQPYGYAAWRPGKAVLVVRNPARGPKKFIGNLTDWLELPKHVEKSEVSRVRAIYVSQSNLKTPVITNLKDAVEFRLPAWGVIVLEVDFR